MSKTIHARIDENTIAGCCDVLELFGQSTEDKAMSRVVAMVLEAYIHELQSRKLIPRYETSGAAEKRIQRAFGMSPLELDEDLIPTKLNFSGQESLMQSDGEVMIHRPPADITSGIADLVQAHLAGQTEVSQNDFDMQESVEETIPPCPYENIQVIDLRKVLEAGVSDKRIDEAIVLADSGDTLRLTAYGVAFLKTPREEWSTQRPHILAESLFLTFSKWRDQYGNSEPKK